MLVAFLASVIAAVAEVRQVALAWKACELDSAGFGWGLMLFHLPMLVLGQTVAVAVIAVTVLRSTAPPSGGFLAVVVGVAAIAACAWAYFHVNGPPVTNSFCRTPQPAWWPRW